MKVIENPSRVVGHRAVTVGMKNGFQVVIFLRFRMAKGERTCQEFQQVGDGDGVSKDGGVIKCSFPGNN